MFKRLKQLRAAWRLSGGDLAVVERLMQQIRENQKLSNNGPIFIAPEDAKAVLELDVPVGDGQAVFFPEATEEEYQDFLHNEENGWKKLKERFIKPKNE